MSDSDLPKDVLEQLKERLEEQASVDEIDIYVSVRRTEIGVQCPDMKETGLSLWLKNNGANVKKVNENGYITAEPATATDSGT